MPHNTARGFTTTLREPNDLPEPPVVEEVSPPSPPPRTGPGSGRQVWADYAISRGVDPEGLTRLAIIELVG